VLQSSKDHQDSAFDSGHDGITYAGLAVLIPDDRRLHVRPSIPKRIVDPDDSCFEDSGSEGPAYLTPGSGADWRGEACNAKIQDPVRAPVG
jgi:hypothetical protein